MANRNSKAGEFADDSKEAIRNLPEFNTGTNTNSRVLVTEADTDNTAKFYNEHKEAARPLTPEIVHALTRRNFWYLLCQTWWISFLIHLDESTLSQASTMGIFDDVNMTKKQYNDLFVLYYTGYLVGLWPGAWIAQRIGHKHFITGSLFIWALLVGVHPAVKTGQQLMAVRFLLGLVSFVLHPISDIDSCLDGLTNHSIHYGASPVVFPSKEQPVGSAPLVVCRQCRQRTTHYGGIQVDYRRGKWRACSRHCILEMDEYHVRYYHFCYFRPPGHICTSLLQLPVS